MEADPAACTPGNCTCPRPGDGKGGAARWLTSASALITAAPGSRPTVGCLASFVSDVGLVAGVVENDQDLRAGSASRRMTRTRVAWTVPAGGAPSHTSSASSSTGTGWFARHNSTDYPGIMRLLPRCYISVRACICGHAGGRADTGIEAEESMASLPSRIVVRIREKEHHVCAGAFNASACTFHIHSPTGCGTGTVPSISCGDSSPLVSDALTGEQTYLRAYERRRLQASGVLPGFGRVRDEWWQCGRLRPAQRYDLRSGPRWALSALQTIAGPAGQPDL